MSAFGIFIVIYIGKSRMASLGDGQDYLSSNKKKRSRNYDNDDSFSKSSSKKKHKKYKKHKKKKKKKKSKTRYDSDTDSEPNVCRRYDSEEEKPNFQQDNGNKDEYNEQMEPNTKKKVGKTALSWYAKLKLAESKKEVGTVHSTGQPSYINIGTGANSERKYLEEITNLLVW